MQRSNPKFWQNENEIQIQNCIKGKGSLWHHQFHFNHRLKSSVTTNSIEP